MVFGQTTFPPVPANYVSQFESLSLTYGVPISWMAAVCQLTSFNAAFHTYNVAIPGFAPATTRQFGSAGIWANAPEYTLPLTVNTSIICKPNQTYPAGWNPTTAQPLIGNVTCSCPQSTSNWSTSTEAPASTTDATVLAEMAAILKDCAQTVQAVFGQGQVNPLVFFRYILGCQYTPEMDPTSGLALIPAIPAALAIAAWNYIEAQAYYAPMFGEDPLLYAPGPTPVCQSGYSWNSTNGLCCNSLSQCQPAVLCPTGTQFDPTTNTCAVIPCSSSFPCVPPLVCHNGTCTSGCDSTHPCVNPYVCVGGICVLSCSASNPCVAPTVCQNGVCVLPCTTSSQCTPGNVCVGGYCGPCMANTDCPVGETCVGGVCTTGGGSSIVPWLIVGGLGLVWLGASALHEKP